MQKALVKTSPKDSGCACCFDVRDRMAGYGAGGYALAAFTQRNYPLPTGDMSTVAMWPTAVIMLRKAPL
jgi:hypothetical protein